MSVTMIPPPRPAEATSLPIDLGSLSALRDTVARFAARYGLVGTAAENLVLVANEMATNVVRHGGGSGRMWLWCTGSQLYCQVADAGPGMEAPDRIGRALARPTASTGRGIWLIRQFSDAVHIDTSPWGTTITVMVVCRGNSAR
jgi:anti-sigma regulatory factor (Ser/Thr protein kinase)